MKKLADPLYAYVRSLLRFEDGNGSTTFTDEISGGPEFSAVSNIVNSTADSKIESGSAHTPDTNSWLVGTVNSDHHLGTDDFCIDAWVKPITSGFSYKSWYGQGINNPQNGITLFVEEDQLAFRTNGFTNLVHTFTAITDWFHVAFVMENQGATDEKRIYLNGTMVANASVTRQDMVPNAPCYACGGGNQASNYRFTGYTDNFRVTVGHPRYTANFTPPSTAADYAGGSAPLFGWAKNRHKVIL